MCAGRNQQHPKPSSLLGRTFPVAEKNKHRGYILDPPSGNHHRSSPFGQKTVPPIPIFLAVSSGTRHTARKFEIPRWLEEATLIYSAMSGPYTTFDSCFECGVRHRKIHFRDLRELLVQKSQEMEVTDVSGAGRRTGAGRLEKTDTTKRKMRLAGIQNGLLAIPRTA